MNQPQNSLNLVPFLLKGDRQSASFHCHQYLEEGNNIHSLYEKIIRPSLYEIGLLWEQNKISVAKEHLSTAIIESVLNELYPRIVNTSPHNKKVVLATAANEEHQIGIKMVSDIFEMKGWKSFYLGTRIPLDQLMNYLEEVNPHVFAISLSIHFNYPGLIKTIETINHLKPKIQILVGGQAFTRINKKNHPELDFHLIHNLNELQLFLENY